MNFAPTILFCLPTPKVKNIEEIELGQFEMETWYFSPFPPEFRDCKVPSVMRGGVCGGGWAP